MFLRARSRAQAPAFLPCSQTKNVSAPSIVQAGPRAIYPTLRNRAIGGEGTQLGRLADCGHIEVGNSDRWHDGPVDPIAPLPAERLFGGANFTDPAE
jgi:hypothetical protein